MPSGFSLYRMLLPVGGFALGGVLGHRFHLSDDGGQFFKQGFNLVHEECSCVRDAAANRRLSRTYGASL